MTRHVGRNGRWSGAGALLSMLVLFCLGANALAGDTVSLSVPDETYKKGQWDALAGDAAEDRYIIATAVAPTELGADAHTVSALNVQVDINPNSKSTAKATCTLDPTEMMHLAHIRGTYHTPGEGGNAGGGEAPIWEGIGYDGVEIYVKISDGRETIPIGIVEDYNEYHFPDDATITWSVENGTGEATINEATGELTGTAEGTVTVKVEAEKDGKTDEDEREVTIEDSLTFEWTDPDDPSKIEYNTPIAKYVDMFEDIASQTKALEPKLEKAASKIKDALVKLDALIPKINWGITDWTTVPQKVQSAYKAVAKATDATVDLMADVITLAESINKATSAEGLVAAFSDNLKIDVHSLTGKKLVLLVSGGRTGEKIAVRNAASIPTKSTASFGAGLGDYSPELDADNLPLAHTQYLTLNGNLGLQIYLVVYRGKNYGPSREVDGYTEQKAWQEIALHWAELGSFLGKLKTAELIVHQTISTVEFAIGVWPDLTVSNPVKATLAMVKNTTRNAYGAINQISTSLFKGDVKESGAMIEALPENAPANGEEHMDSKSNANTFPVIVS